MNFTSKDSIDRLSSNYGETILSRLRKLQADGILTDVVLKSGKEEVRAHRCILVASSEYFRATFTGFMKESKLESPTIELQQIVPGYLGPLVNFMYGGDLEISLSNVSQLLDGASHLQLERLIAKCCNFLDSNIEIENCLSLQTLAETYSCQSLLFHSKSFVLRNFKDVISTPEFLELSFQKLSLYLKSNEISVSKEDILFYAICKWISHDEMNRKCFAMELFDCLRLELIAPDFIANEIHDHPFFNDTQKFISKILKAYKWHCAIFPTGSNSSEFSSRAIAPTTSNVLLTSAYPEHNACLIQRRKPFVRSDALRSSLFIFGGDDGFDDRNPYSDTYFFDVELQEWVTVAALQNRRSVCGFASLDSTRFLVIGGYDGERAMDSVEEFDSKTNVWTNLPPLNQRRCSSNCAKIGESIYVVGGVCGPHALNHVESYSTNTRSWTVRPSMQEPRSACGVVATTFPRPAIYAIGGINAFGETVASAELFDIGTQSWRSIPPMLTPRRSFGLILMGGFIYAVGGNDGASDVRSVEAFDLNSRCWKAVAPMTQARMYCTVAVYDGSLIAIGGMDGITTLNTAEKYCSVTDSWTPFLVLPKAICGCGAAVVDCVPHKVIHSKKRQRVDWLELEEEQDENEGDNNTSTMPSVQRYREIISPDGGPHLVNGDHEPSGFMTTTLASYGHIYLPNVSSFDLNRGLLDSDDYHANLSPVGADAASQSYSPHTTGPVDQNHIFQSAPPQSCLTQTGEGSTADVSSSLPHSVIELAPVTTEGLLPEEGSSDDDDDTNDTPPPISGIIS